MRLCGTLSCGVFDHGIAEQQQIENQSARGPAL